MDPSDRIVVTIFFGIFVEALPFLLAGVLPRANRSLGYVRLGLPLFFGAFFYRNHVKGQLDSHVAKRFPLVLLGKVPQVRRLG